MALVGMRIEPGLLYRQPAGSNRGGGVFSVALLLTAPYRTPGNTTGDIKEEG